MKEIIIGRDGNQPFKISDKRICVSSNHASITIDDYGRWLLKDLGSANGTFIRNDTTGNLIPVDSAGVSISESTFIVLAADNSTGCCFYARQILSPSDYFSEHQYMLQKKEEFDQKEENVSKKPRIIRLVIFGIMAVFTALTFNTSFQQLINNLMGDKSGNNFFVLYRFLSMGSMGFSAIYDVQAKKDKIKKLRSKFNQCPNPECDHRLSKDEIENLKCKKCKK